MIELRMEIAKEVKYCSTLQIELADALDAIADEFDKQQRKLDIARLTLANTGVVGGILMIVGMSLAPVTFGASLGLTIAGGVVGGGTAVGSLGSVAIDLYISHGSFKTATTKLVKYSEKIENIRHLLPALVKKLTEPEISFVLKLIENSNLISEDEKRILISMLQSFDIVTEVQSTSLSYSASYIYHQFVNDIISAFKLTNKARDALDLLSGVAHTATEGVSEGVTGASATDGPSVVGKATVTTSETTTAFDTEEATAAATETATVSGTAGKASTVTTGTAATSGTAGKTVAETSGKASAANTGTVSAYGKARIIVNAAIETVIASFTTRKVVGASAETTTAVGTAGKTVTASTGTAKATGTVGKSVADTTGMASASGSAGKAAAVTTGTASASGTMGKAVVATTGTTTAAGTAGKAAATTTGTASASGTVGNAVAATTGTTTAAGTAGKAATTITGTASASGTAGKAAATITGTTTASGTVGKAVAATTGTTTAAAGTAGKAAATTTGKATATASGNAAAAGTAGASAAKVGGILAVGFTITLDLGLIIYYSYKIHKNNPSALAQKLRKVSQCLIKKLVKSLDYDSNFIHLIICSKETQINP